MRLGARTRELLLEERMHHDCRRADVLEAQHHVEVLRERRRAGEERTGKVEIEIARPQIHQATRPARDASSR